MPLGQSCDSCPSCVRERALAAPADRVFVSCETLDRSYGRLGRPHGLPLHPGKPTKRDPPRAGQAHRSIWRRPAAMHSSSRCAMMASASIPGTPIGFGISGMQEPCRRSAVTIRRERPRPRHLRAHRDSGAQRAKRAGRRRMTSVLIHRRPTRSCCRAAGASCRMRACARCSMPPMSCPATASTAVIIPRLVIIDLAMQGSGLGGLPLIRRIHAHASAHAHPRLQHAQRPDHRCPRAGSRCHGYVLKDTSSEERFKAFEKVRLRHALSQRRHGHAVAPGADRRAQEPLADLTPRELETLSAAGAGKPYGRIAEDST